MAADLDRLDGLVDMADYSPITKLAIELDSVQGVRLVNRHPQWIEVKVDIANGQWGMSRHLTQWLKSHPEARMIDFRNVSENSINLFFEHRPVGGDDR